MNKGDTVFLNYTAYNDGWSEDYRGCNYIVVKVNGETTKAKDKQDRKIYNLPTKHLIVSKYADGSRPKHIEALIKMLLRGK